MAEAHALGSGSLAGLDEAGVFAEIGEIELSAFLAMTAALEVFSDAPNATAFDLPWDAEASHAPRLQAAGAREGLRAIALRRHPMPANFDKLHHPSYIDLWNEVFPETNDVHEIHHQRPQQPGEPTRRWVAHSAQRPSPRPQPRSTLRS